VEPDVNASSAGASLLLLSLLGGCDGGLLAEEPAPVPEAAVPVPPAGWAWVASADGGIWLSLPPWLLVSDRQGAIFANERAVGEGLQLMAEGNPDLPPSPGDVERWLTERLASRAAGAPSMERIALPAGTAVHPRRLDAAGCPLAWRIEAWAIDTPRGFAFLMVDGPPAAWTTREDDVRQIAALLRVAPPPEPPPGATPGGISE
jgi:hypothetical protein